MMHNCPAKGCTKAVPAHRLACPTHWYQLPKDIRDDVWAAYFWPGPGSEEHTAAVGAALEWYRMELP